MAVGEESSDKMKKPPFNRFSVAKALALAGLESSNLIVGIDFTKSNGWTGTTLYNRSLHHIGDSLNPYEQAISIIGKTLAAFDEDNLTPFYGFEDGSFTGRHWCTYVFDERPFNGPILISYRISPGTSTKGLVACSGIRRICFPACPISAPANELCKVAKSCCIKDEDFSVVTDALRVKLQNQSKE